MRKLLRRCYAIFYVTFKDVVGAAVIGGWPCANTVDAAEARKKRWQKIKEFEESFDELEVDTDVADDR
jgi:hypothetical protein